VRVLITGAAGNLGRKLAAHWHDRHDLVLLDRPEGDLADWDERWVNRFAGVEAVVHLAGDPVAYHEWPELLGPNVDAVANVLAAAAKHGVTRFVFASSNHVMGGYQDGPPLPITETLPPKPGLRYFADGAERFSGAYGAAKLMGERLCRTWAMASGGTAIAIRLGWVWRGDNRPECLPAERGEWFRQMWLSDDDYVQLMDGCLTAAVPEHYLVVNGMSDNPGKRWDSTVARTRLNS
jgi:NAD+ dependent glucose-6-phosphate dehydrogenase